MFYHPNLKKDILLVEDNPGDIRLIEEAFNESKTPINLITVTDGLQAMRYLNKETPYEKTRNPDLILLDLNIPKKHGLSVLKDIKFDPELRRIPVIVLTLSSAEFDIRESYNLHANCCIVKPYDLETLLQIVKSINHFWFSTVTLGPEKEKIND